MLKKNSLICLGILLLCGTAILNAQFVDNGDGTITDTEKGIMWTKNAKMSGSSSLTYTEAVNWVNNLNHAGHQDWRLPTGTDPRNDPNRTTPDNQYYYNCRESEFGDLFYNKLGGTAGLRIDQKYVNYAIVANDDPDLDNFENILGASSNASIYWTAIKKDADHAWTFSFWSGSYKAILSSAASTYRMGTWAVRDVGGQQVTNAPPTHFNVLSDYNGVMIMAWKAPGDMTGFIGYDIYRSVQGGAMTMLAGGVQTQYYRDESAVNGVNYSYSVTAVYSTGTSAMAAAAAGTCQADGYTIYSGPVSAAPTLDGVIGGSEWSAAGTVDITYPGVSQTVTLYAMNTGRYLYLAVDDPNDTVLDNVDGLGIFFDENLDRLWPVYPSDEEGLIQIYRDGASVLTAHQPLNGIWPDVTGLSWVTPAGVEGEISSNSGHVQYEVRIDLISGVVNQPLDGRMGWSIYVFEGGSSSFNGQWPQETVNKLADIVSGYGWSHGPFSYGDLILSHDSDVGDETNTAPGAFSLDQNYPNPFNPETVIQYNIPESSHITLSIFDMNGRTVRKLINKFQASGNYQIFWDGRDDSGKLLGSGMYLYSLEAGAYSQSRKMVFIK